MLLKRLPSIIKFKFFFQLASRFDCNCNTTAPFLTTEYNSASVYISHCTYSNDSLLGYYTVYDILFRRFGEHASSISQKICEASTWTKLSLSNDPVRQFTSCYMLTDGQEILTGALNIQITNRIDPIMSTTIFAHRLKSGGYRKYWENAD
jgi:hypothetical protein